MNPYKICSINECKGKVQARGLCWKHYQRMLRHGNTDDPEYPNKNKVCSVNDCDKEAHSYGMCVMHRKRILKHNDPNVVLREPSHDGHVCVISDCNERVRSRVFCNNHYHNYLYHLERKNIETIQDYLEYVREKSK